MKVIVIVVLLLIMVTGCSNKEQIYEGVYKGMGAMEQNRRAEDPSYDPITGSEQPQPGYHIYKMERQEILKKDDSVNNEVK